MGEFHDRAGTQTILTPARDCAQPMRRALLRNHIVRTAVVGASMIAGLSARRSACRSTNAPTVTSGISIGRLGLRTIMMSGLYGLIAVLLPPSAPVVRGDRD